MLKKFLKSQTAANIGSSLISTYLRLVFATSRSKIVNLERFTDALEQNKGVIVAFWHGRLMLMPAVRPASPRPIHMLISVHRDGDIIANAVKPFDVRFVRGSAANPKKPTKNKGGAGAVGQMLDILQSGEVIGLTPDGPRGPREKLQPGIVKLSALSGAPIIPVGISAARGKKLKSWDRFLLAYPFNRCVCAVGEAIFPSPDDTQEAIESARQTVEKALQEATRTADELAGLSIEHSSAKIAQ